MLIEANNGPVMHKALNFHLIHYSPLTSGEDQSFIPFTQESKPKLSVPSQDQGQWPTHGRAGLAVQAADSGSWPACSWMSQVSWTQRTPLSFNLCQETSNFSPHFLDVCEVSTLSINHIYTFFVFFKKKHIISRMR